MLPIRAITRIQRATAGVQWRPGRACGASGVVGMAPKALCLCTPAPDLCQSARSVPVLHARRPIRVETSLSAARILGSALSALQRITIFRLEARLRSSTADGWTAARERRRALVGRWRARHPGGVGLRGQGRCYRGICGNCAVDRAHGLNSSSSSAHATNDAGSRLNSDSVFPRPAERKIQFVSRLAQK